MLQNVALKTDLDLVCHESDFVPGDCISETSTNAGQGPNLAGCKLGLRIA